MNLIYIIFCQLNLQYIKILSAYPMLCARVAARCGQYVTARSMKPGVHLMRAPTKHIYLPKRVCHTQNVVARRKTNMTYREFALCNREETDIKYNSIKHNMQESYDLSGTLYACSFVLSCGAFVYLGACGHTVLEASLVAAIPWYGVYRIYRRDAQTRLSEKMLDEFMEKRSTLSETDAKKLIDGFVDYV